MINSVSPSSPLAEFPADGQGKTLVAEPKTEAPHAAAEPVPRAEANRDLRLVIEFDKQRNYYIYRLIDRDTGNVVTSIPRTEVEQLAESPDYSAGGVISTTA